MAIESAIGAVDAFETLFVRVMGVAEALGCRGDSDCFTTMLSDVLYDQVDAMLDLRRWLNSIEDVVYCKQLDGTGDSMN